jgi:hypothetical protein
MKRAVLQEAIQNIFAHKLLEAKGAANKYGYVLSGKGTPDPVLQMNGFGNMAASAWKKKIMRDIADLAKKVNADDWHGAEYLLRPDGILHNSIAMMDECMSDPKLREAIGSTDSNAAANPPLNTGTIADRDKTDLMKYEKRLADLTNSIKELEAKIADRMESINKANKHDEIRKAQLTRQQGPIIKKIDQLKKKIGTQTPAATQQIRENDTRSLVGKTLRWPHHDEPTVPQNCVGKVLSHMQPDHASPDWVEVEVVLPNDKKTTVAMRGDEGRKT